MRNVVQAQTSPDPDLEEAIDIALARLAPGLTAAQAEEMRRSIRFAMAADPYAQDILHRLGARPHVKRSDTLCTTDARADSEAEGTGGRR